MSIGATRKVGTSTSSPRTERSYSANGQKTQFVEVIDTQNNVLVRDEAGEHHKQPEYYASHQSEEENSDFSPSSAYVQNSISALAASGIFDSETPPDHTSHKVSVYDNNQSIIHDEELERTGRNYLKHFYEKNEHLIDVDKLV